VVSGGYKCIIDYSDILIVNNGIGDGEYIAGSTVTITANEAPIGKVFDKWLIETGNPSIADLYSVSTSLIMPATNVTVTAIYKPASNETVMIKNKKTQNKIRPLPTEGNSIVQAPEEWTGPWVQWEVLPTSNGYFRLKNKGNNQFMSM